MTEAMQKRFQTAIDIELLVQCGHVEVTKEPEIETKNFDVNKFKLNLNGLQDSISPSILSGSPLDRSQSPKTCVINQGEVYIQQQIEREAAHIAVKDKNNAPIQYWHDNLRASDDGRFSKRDS